MMDRPQRFDILSQARVRYCARELDDGTRCSHHIVIHRGCCQGLDAWENPCKCQGYEEPREP